MIIHLNRSRAKRLFTYILLLIISLSLLYGRPKFIFQTHLHIPWLTDVQHIQPLNCISFNNENNWPNPILSNEDHIKQDNRLTIVIVTAQPEFKRLPLTLAALACHLDSRRIYEVMFLIPENDINILKPYISGQRANYWPWPLTITSDNYLLKHTHTDSYRLQMIFKLIVSQIIKTEYYMLLDSDCVAIWPIHVEQLLWKSNVKINQNKSLPLFKALYQTEERSDRNKWWPESEQLLQIEPNTCVSNEPTSSTIGVTPIILSKTIALRTLCDKNFLNKLANWALWKVIFDRMWTEYTLYYLTARCTKIFDTYHYHQTTLSSFDSPQSIHFYGLSVWWRTDWTSYTRHELVKSVNIGLKWRQKEINENNGRIIIDTSMDTHYLFTVLQGRQYINPNLYHQLLYSLFINYLKKQNNTQELVKILDNMVEQLIKN